MFGFRQLPEVTKNLIIINVIVLLALMTYPSLTNKVALYYFSNSNFRPWQLITHMFAHGGFGHLFFNMFTLFMFGSVLERVIGSKRFFNFYLLTGLGGAFLHLFVIVLQVYHLSGKVWITPDILQNLAISYQDKVEVMQLISIPMVGASGAIFGVLIGFAYLFPDTQLMLIFPPIPMKAKTLVFLLIIFELYMGYEQAGNIAHFAHLGGALFGYLILKFWKQKGILR
ncbi:MAG: rhomboid family intramembrane serine protease [Chitinophagales bacterium]|nr:rhomboid family intramembrane serine protease [Chitinophagales bacterium]